MKMFGECHAHIFLNGYDYRKAVETQKNGPRDTLIRAHFEEYRKRGIRFVRDGGDHYGVSKRAARLAPEYEIDYRTPVFAIYKEGHYGKIVGKSFSDMKEYHRRVYQDHDYRASGFCRSRENYGNAAFSNGCERNGTYCS